MFKRTMMALGLVFAQAAVAQAAPLAERVPGDALVYVGWTGSTEIGPEYDQSRLKEILEATNLDELVGPYLIRAAARLAEEEPEAGAYANVLAEAAEAFWKYPSALYIGPPSEDSPIPTVAILCRAGDQAMALAQRWEQTLAQAGEAGQPVPARAEAGDGMAALTIGELPREKLARMGLLQGVGGPAAAAGLTDNANFQTALAKIERDGVVVFYVDAEAIIRAIDAQALKMAPSPQPAQPGGPPPVNEFQYRGPEQEFAENWPKVRDALGLAGVKRFIMSDGFDGRDWACSGYLEAPEPRTGLVSLINTAKPLDDEMLRLVPDSAAIVMGGRFSFAQLYDVIDEAAGKIEPQAQEQLRALEQQASMMVNTPLRANLLASLGDEWIVYTDRAVGGSNVMGFVLVNRLADAAKAEQAMLDVQQAIEMMVQEQMAEMPIRVTFRQIESEGLTVHYLAVPMFAPAWAIRDGYLFVSLYPQNVIAADAFTRSGRPDFRANRPFLALRERLGGAKVSAFQYYDIAQNGDDGYVTLVGMVQMLAGLSDMFGVPSPAIMMPPLHKLHPHFQPALSTAWVDEQGVHMRGLSPFPGAEQFAVQANSAMMQQVFMLGAMMPAMMAAPPHNAQRMEINTRARGIHQGAVQYSQGNNQVLAPDLYTLLESNMFTMEYVMHPDWGDPTPPDFDQWPREQKVQWVDENAMFVYLGKDVTFNADSRRIVVYQKAEFSDNGTIAVCFDDNHVEVMPMEQARQRIMAQTGADPFGGEVLMEEGEEGMEWHEEEATPEAPPPAPFR